MAIKGSLKEASLADVLQLLSLGQKTGCLTVTDKANLGYIYFDKGRISYASLVNRRDRLGDILVKNGKITQEQLMAAIEEQGRERTLRVGEILVRSGALSREDLEHYMRVQIEEAVFFLFTWTSGHFNFESEVLPEQDFLVSINPESLLLEGARRVDEWSLIEKKIPSFDVIFTIDRERLESSDEVTLTEEQQRLVPLLDGKRDVGRVVEDSGLVEFEVGKALYGLITAGFVHRTGQTRTTRPTDVADARVDEHRNLGVAFLRTGMLDEAQREFRRVVELRPSDGSAYFQLGLIGLRQAHWDEAVEYFNQASERGGGNASVLANLAFAYEKAGRMDEAEAAYGEAAAKARQDQRILTGWGIVALRRGDFEVAGGRLDRAKEVARDQPLDAIWYWARALAAGAVEQLDVAEVTLREGIERYPDNVVLRNNLAVLLEILGQVEAAEQVLRDALAEDPSVPQLSKNLGDLLYRTGNYDEAWDAYRRAITLKPQLGDDVYFKLGNIAYKRLDREAAAEYWTKALELNPQHELARTNLETVSALT
ncbi:MAG: tetratricopeptide repeat protein [Gemmatimonadales bacterium]|jgi:Tfp pilus assembly protein PilF